MSTYSNTVRDIGSQSYFTSPMMKSRILCKDNSFHEDSSLGRFHKNNFK